MPTSSLNAVQASNGMSAYCASKAGLAMLVQVAALELGPRGIRVNAIAPGLVRTPLTDAMWLLPAIVEDFDENAPLATTTSAEDVASLVTFLASDESTSISGTLQLIDRGAHTKRYPDLPAHFARPWRVPATERLGLRRRPAGLRSRRGASWTRPVRAASRRTAGGAG